MSADQEIEARYREAWQRRSDICEHVPTLRWYAEQCERVTELGTRTAVSTTALLAARPKMLHCYDLKRDGNVAELERLAPELGVEFRFFENDVRQADIAPTDLLFIDTYHHHDQLTAELARHAPQAARFLIFHDTMTFGWRGENGRVTDGLLTALHEFLYRNKEWRVARSYPDNNGLTVLGKGRFAEMLPPPSGLHGVERTGRTVLFGECIERPETIFPAKPQAGLVVGTYGSVPYVHLQLEARRRFDPGLPMLIHDDASPRQAELQALCAEYGADFESNLHHYAHGPGDMSALLGGLVWARERGLDVLAKFSRRFLPLRNWSAELVELALAAQYPTYSSWTRAYGLGFRTESIAVAVDAWFGAGAVSDLAQALRGPGVGLVETYVHGLARRAAAERCRQALAYDERHGYRPHEISDYAIWPFLGFNRRVRSPQFLWYEAASPADYAAVAKEWGLPYCVGDFEKPDGFKR